MKSEWNDQYSTFKTSESTVLISNYVYHLWYMHRSKKSSIADCI